MSSITRRCQPCCAPTSSSATITPSTSTLSSPALESGGFGPVNADCYGIGYRINDEGAGAQVMTYDRDSRGFAEHLAGAMADMRAVLDGGEADTPIQTAYDTKNSS